MSSLAILTVATKSYQACIPAQIRGIKQNVTLAGIQSGHVILVTDENPVAGILAQYKAMLGEAWEVHHVPLALADGQENYKTAAQLVIAQLFTAGFDKARDLGVDYVWTLESDVLPEPNNLRCMRDMLAFDGGYYDVAFCPYISQGKGGVMGGRGHSRAWILPNIYEDERELSPELQTRHEAVKAGFAALQRGEQPSAELRAECEEVKKLIDQSPPKGNIFELNAKGWRQRGWFESAYPGIGKGAVVPSDWFPMGNNLFSARTIPFLDFIGYEGGGTQDLFLSYKLAAQGFKFCVIPHSPSSHVVRDKQPDGTVTPKLMRLYHEPAGDAVGHLRQQECQYYAHSAGEQPARLDESYSI